MGYRRQATAREEAATMIESSSDSSMNDDTASRLQPEMIYSPWSHRCSSLAVARRL